MVAYGETGAAWEETNIVSHLLDSVGHVREAAGEDGRGKMAYQVRDEQEAHDLWAYLATFAPSDLQAASRPPGSEASSGAEVEPVPLASAA